MGRWGVRLGGFLERRLRRGGEMPGNEGGSDVVVLGEMVLVLLRWVCIALVDEMLGKWTVQKDT